MYQRLVKVPLTLEDREFLKNSQCGYLNKQPLVCCPDSLGSETILNQGDNLLPNPGVCGTPSIDFRLLGEIETSFIEFPWTALLQYSKPNAPKDFH